MAEMPELTSLGRLPMPTRNQSLPQCWKQAQSLIAQSMSRISCAEAQIAEHSGLKHSATPEEVRRHEAQRARPLNLTRTSPKED